MEQITERCQRIPILLNGEGDYVDDMGCCQPINYHMTKKIEIPPGCFVMMVNQEEFTALKSGQATMLADGMLRKRFSYSRFQ
jgi:hypothetical protein